MTSNATQFDSADNNSGNPLSWCLDFCAMIGAGILNFLASVGKLADFTFRSVTHCFRPPFYPSQLMRQLTDIGYYSLLDLEKCDPKAFTWANRVFWQDVADIPELAFDHNNVLNDGLVSLQREVKRRPVGFELLPDKFTLGELQALYEALLNERYDKANFRKRFLSMNLLHSLKESQTDVPHRPGRLYSFDKSRYEELKTKGFSFEFK